MAFKLAPKNQIKTKVVVEVLGDLNQVEKSDFVATFRKLAVSDVRYVVESVKSGDVEENDLIKENLIDWEGVLDYEKNEVSFNAENLNSLLEIVEARKALAAAFWRVQSGEIARKN